MFCERLPKGTAPRVPRSSSLSYATQETEQLEQATPGCEIDAWSRRLRKRSTSASSTSRAAVWCRQPARGVRHRASVSTTCSTVFREEALRLARPSRSAVAQASAKSSATSATAAGLPSPIWSACWKADYRSPRKGSGRKAPRTRSRPVVDLAPQSGRQRASSTSATPTARFDASSRTAGLAGRDRFGLVDRGKAGVSIRVRLFERPVRGRRRSARSRSPLLPNTQSQAAERALDGDPS